MPIIPYEQFQGRLARERSSGDVIPYELGPDGTYRPVITVPTNRPTGRPVPTRNPGLGAIGAAIDAVCLARAAAPNNFLRNLVSASPFDVVPGVRNARERAFNYLCDETPNAGVPTQVPFQGGQCAGARYLVSGSGTRYSFSNFQCNNGTWQSQTVELWGPISGSRLRKINPGGYAFEVYCRGTTSQPIRSPFWASVTSVTSSSLCPDAALVNTVVAPAPNQPNNCGNPVPQYPTDEEVPLTGPIQVEIPISPTDTVLTPVNVSFNPQIGIQIDVGDINITFDGDNISYDEPTDPGGGGEIPPLTPPSDDCPTRPDPDDTTIDPADPPPEPPPDEPDLEEPEDPPAQVIRAALVTVTDPGNQATQIAGLSPDPPNYFGDLGLIKFRIKAADGATGFTNPIRVQNRRAFIVCPWDGGAIEVVGTPRPGVAWVITPVYDVSSITP